MPVVYALYDSRQPHRYRYVGRTVDAAKRLARHRSSKEDSHCARWCRKVQREGGAVEITVLATASDTQIAFLEAFYIHALREAGYCLVNTVIPSKGDLSGRVLWSDREREARKWSDERRLEWSERMKRHFADGKKPATFTRKGTSRKPRKRQLREYGPGGAKWMCECGLTTTAGPLSKHQQVSGHSKKSLADVQPTKNVA